MSAFVSVFSQIFDVVVYGSGYAAFAAAASLRDRGKTVLLVNRHPALLWESTWAFFTTAGSCDAPGWRALLERFKAHRGASDDFIDGAIAEPLATRLLIDAQIPVLYYAAPITAHVEGNCVTAVAVAMKGEVRVVRARQFVDASESGELLAILSPSYIPPTAARQTVQLFLRQIAWADIPATELSVPGMKAVWSPSFWPNERILTLDLPGDTPRHRTAWLPALRALRDTFPAEHAVVTHASVIPYRSYSPHPPREAGSLRPQLPDNFALAIPAFSSTTIETLADRYALGLAAAKSLADLSAAKITTIPDNFATTPHTVEYSADVAVAGTGTGGVCAALAAAREGMKVAAIESLPFLGGTSTGSGIHIYYFGVRGGLQEELDERVREVMPLFGKNEQIIGFHPDAKKIAIEQMFEEANIATLTETTLYGAEHCCELVRSASLATLGGAARLSAKVWIDSTGDADLAALAGVPFGMGRQYDSNVHAFSQTAGRCVMHNGVPRLRMMNTDVGYVDPSDAEDMTRARMVGVAQWVQASYTEIERPVYISPHMGIRQSRQIETDYAVTLADLTVKRTFPDAVGYTACHYDNHALDYQFESDETVFFVWVARQWHAELGSQLPYRMILPKGLENLLIACRSAGVTVEAHPMLRQQRDIQRLGEVAGCAAALAIKHNCSSRGVPYAELRRILEASGALSIDRSPVESFTWEKVPGAYFEQAAMTLDEALAEMQSGSGMGLYQLYLNPEFARTRVAELLGHADSAVTFRAAALLAMWGDSAAERRLLEAVETREYGFDDAPADRRPEVDPRVVPHHMVALTLLRQCCTIDSLAVFERLSGNPELPHNARTAIALNLEAFAHRQIPAKAGAMWEQFQRILANLLATPAPQTIRNPKRWPDPPTSLAPTDRAPVLEDFSWQIHLSVAKAELAVGLPVHRAAAAFLQDPRALVRKAFYSLTASTSSRTIFR